MCTLELVGNFPKMVHTYSRRTPPEKGDDVTIFFDPQNKKTSATLDAGLGVFKWAFVGGLALGSVLLAVTTVLLYRVRNDPNFQRLGAAVGVLDFVRN